MEQIAIAVLGITAVWLSQDSRVTYRRWSSVFGLSVQPFWLYASFINEQWGIFIISIVYTVAWAKGFKNNFLRKDYDNTTH